MDQEVSGAAPKKESANNGASIPTVETAEVSAQRKIADRPHHWTLFLSIAAVLVSLASACTSIYQYRLALQAREDARESAKKQIADVERTRKAAEDSADAAKASLAIAGRSARAAETSALAAKLGLDINERNARAAETNASTSQRLYDLNFAPLIDVTYNTSNGAVNLFNRGKDNITLLGASYNGQALQPYRAVIAPGSSSPIFFSDFTQRAVAPAIVNQTQQTRVGSEFLIQTADGRKYVVPVIFAVLLRGNHLELVNPLIQPIREQKGLE